MGDVMQMAWQMVADGTPYAGADDAPRGDADAGHVRRVRDGVRRPTTR